MHAPDSQQLPLQDKGSIWRGVSAVHAVVQGWPPEASSRACAALLSAPCCTCRTHLHLHGDLLLPSLIRISVASHLQTQAP